MSKSPYNAKHTPGEWIFDLVIGSVYGFNRFGDWIRLADCSPADGDEISDEEVEANGHLIAAAPEMLDALKLVLATSAPGENVELFRQVTTAARAAIAKAEGRANV